MNIQPLIDAITQAGGAIYAVGGSVRDEFLGYESKDLDVLVTGVPYEQLSGTLASLGTIDEVGKSFGIIKFKLGGKGQEIDVALPRTERSTGPGHTAFAVTSDHTLPIEEDLLRRDFTINAMARSLVSGELIDPYGGQKACEQRQLVTVSPESFVDDPLRILRGVQFAARFDLDVTPCLGAMSDHVDGLKHISSERIAVELGKLFSKAPTDRLVQAIGIINNIGAWDILFGSDYYEDTVYQPGYLPLSCAPKEIHARLALFFHSHCFFGKQMTWAEEIIDRLKLSVIGIQKPLVLKLTKYASNFNHEYAESGVALRKFIAYELGGSRLLFARVLEIWGCMETYYSNSDPKSGTIRFEELQKCSVLYIREVEGKALSLSELAVNGNDVQACGYQGKAIGEKLKELLWFVLENPDKNDKANLLGSLLHIQG